MKGLTVEERSTLALIVGGGSHMASRDEAEVAMRLVKRGLAERYERGRFAFARGTELGALMLTIPAHDVVTP